jgi:hypothetical protein
MVEIIASLPIAKGQPPVVIASKGACDPTIAPALKKPWGKKFCCPEQDPSIMVRVFRWAILHPPIGERHPRIQPYAVGWCEAR